MTFGRPYIGTTAPEDRPLLHFLIVTEAKVPQFISVTLREGLDFIDDLDEEFGSNHIVATESTWPDGSPR